MGKFFNEAGRFNGENVIPFKKREKKEEMSAEEPSVAADLSVITHNPEFLEIREMRELANKIISFFVENGITIDQDSDEYKKEKEKWKDWATAETHELIIAAQDDARRLWRKNPEKYYELAIALRKKAEVLEKSFPKKG